MKYGFIGVGNMATAILKGLHKGRKLTKHEFFLYDLDESKKDFAVKKFGLNGCNSAAEVVLTSEVVFLAIKPNQLFDLLDGLKDEIRQKQPTLVSLPVGISMEEIEAKLGFNVPIIRVVANVNTEVFLSVTSICTNQKSDITEEVATLLESIGSVIEIDEKFFDIFTVIASSAPAFVIKFSEALAEAALREGLPKDAARKIIADMIHGTGKMLGVSHPADTTDKICSPGGTTIVGLTTLTAGGFDSAIHSAVDDCMKKLRG